MTPEGPPVIIEVWQHPSTLSTVLCYLATCAFAIWVIWSSKD